MATAKEKKMVLGFIKRHTITVLSTVTAEGKSESAVIEFGETDNFELIFDCLSHYRKYKNLQKNKNISAVIGWDENITVQYEGEAKEIFGDEQEEYKKLYFAKNPKAAKWANVEGIKFFKVKPIWIRYSNLKTHPWEIIEIDF